VVVVVAILLLLLVRKTTEALAAETWGWITAMLRQVSMSFKRDLRWVPAEEYMERARVGGGGRRRILV